MQFVLVSLLLEGVLREDFAHTLYSTVSYLFLGNRYGAVVLWTHAEAAASWRRAHCL